MIELSNNEAASLIKLAARGVGYPWGMGEEAVYVSHWLVERQLPALELFNVLFTWVDEQEYSNLGLQNMGSAWSCRREELCPIVCGSAIIDAAKNLLTNDSIELKNVVCPILILPFISEVSLVLEKSICVQCAGAELVVHGKQIELSGENGELLSHNLLKGLPASLSIRVVNDASETQAKFADSAADIFDASNVELWPIVSHSRVSTNALCIAPLKQYAHRTYAPATEQSRLSGAGAGTSDND